MPKSLGSLSSLNDANATGNGGELNLNADRLTVRDGAMVTGQALDTASAGDSGEGEDKGRRKTLRTREIIKN